MKFGDRLAEIRKQKKLTQDQLGAGLGTDGADASKAVVLGWEKNRHFPRVDQLIMICDKLGVGADYLLFGKVSESALHPDVLALASDINQLPGRQRDLVLMTVRNAVALAGTIIQDEPRTGNIPENTNSHSEIHTVRRSG